MKQKLQQWLIEQDDFLQYEGNMPILATHEQYRLDTLGHPKNTVKLLPDLKNALDGLEFYTHRK